MSLMLVFDTKQTLYMWRSARPDLAEHMSALLGKETQEGTIRMNYRSPKQLVLLSNYFSDLFRGHHMEVVYSEPYKPVQKNCLSLRLFENTHQEIRYLVNDIRGLQESGVKWKEISILARTNKSLLDLEAGLISGKVPYTVKYDSRSVMNQSPFKVMYSIYSLMFNPRDIHSFCEILLPIKGIGPKFLDEIKSQFYLTLKTNQLATVFKSIPKNRGKSKQWDTTCNFISKILKPIQDSFKRDNSNFLSFNREARAILSRYLRFEKSENDMAFFQVKIEYSQFTRVFHTLNNIYHVLTEDVAFSRKSETEQFLEIYQNLSLSQENYSNTMQDKRIRREDKNRVTLYTYHSYKGKENNYIYIANLRPVIPVNPLDFENICCMYVAVTRAKRKLSLSFSENTLCYSGQFRKAPENKLLDFYTEGIERLKQEI